MGMSQTEGDGLQAYQAFVLLQKIMQQLDDEDGSSGVDQDAFNAFVCESIRYDLDGI